MNKLHSILFDILHWSMLLVLFLGWLIAFIVWFPLMFAGEKIEYLIDVIRKKNG